MENGLDRPTDTNPLHFLDLGLRPTTNSCFPMRIPWTDETTGAVVIVIEDAVLELDGGGLSGKSSSGHQRVVDY